NQAPDSHIEESFAPENWIPEAAKRAGQLSLVSHPSKFTHPSAKTSSIVFKSEFIADGFLRSGNVYAQLDVFGNAAALDVYKFLSLTLMDGKTVLEHLENDTPCIREQFKGISTPFEKLRSHFLAIKRDKFPKVRTSSQVKQVYFPVADNYHLLSILTPSGLIFALKERIQALRFSDDTKQAREAEKSNVFHSNGFEELHDLVVIGFGGTKPQNISVLNNKFHGESYLLTCIPPQLKARSMSVPITDFFKNSAYSSLNKDSFKFFHRLITQEGDYFSLCHDENNVIHCMMDAVIGRVWQLRQLEAGWSETTQLPHYQKVWLDSRFTKERVKDESWLLLIAQDFVMWFVEGYKKTMGKEAKVLSEAMIREIQTLVEENKDGLL
ncbi:MAG: CRISPR-associated Csy1 family protein, partial [Pseudomonadota bacterium]|nr:CRISPR-associated Csy1 family protein [Pseudomonadota bacterium]